MQSNTSKPAYYRIPISAQSRYRQAFPILVCLSVGWLLFTWPYYLPSGVIELIFSLLFIYCGIWFVRLLTASKDTLLWLDPIGYVDLQEHSNSNNRVLGANEPKASGQISRYSYYLGPVLQLGIESEAKTVWVLICQDQVNDNDWRRLKRTLRRVKYLV